MGKVQNVPISQISIEIMNNIDDIIKRNHLSAKEFAKKIGKRPGIVTDWRTGRATPSIDALIDICINFNCSVNDIIPSYLFTPKDNHQAAMAERLITYYRGMSSDDQKELFMLAEYKYNKTKSS